MNETTSYITCMPSQLLNLGVVLRVLILIPVLLLLDEMLRESLAARFVPEQMAKLLLSFPALLGAIAGTCLLYQVLRVRSIRYEITPGELKIYSGILSRKHEYIELFRVKGAHVKGAIVNIPLARYLASVRKASHPSAYP
ncbi:MAG: hypothetical protein JW801_02640 [Bacteroidales bacterium]|nr:hypothetical protein [Bacteroidales bacterium]